MTARVSLVRASASRQRADVAQERLNLQAVSGGVLEQRDCVEAPSVAMYVLGEPPLDRGEFAAAQVILTRAELRLYCLPKLCGDQAAERVAGEVAEAAGAPVHVLQAAECVGWNLDPEQP